MCVLSVLNARKRDTVLVATGKVKEIHNTFNSKASPPTGLSYCPKVENVGTAKYFFVQPVACSAVFDTHGTMAFITLWQENVDLRIL